MNYRHIRYIEIILVSMVLCITHGKAFGMGGDKNSKTPIASSPPNYAKKVSIEKLQLWDLEYISGKEIPKDVKIIDLRPEYAGDPDEIEDLFRSSKEEGVKPLVDYVLDNACSGVCVLNARPRNCLKRCIAGFAGRDSMFYAASPIKDSVWVLSPGVADALFKKSIGIDLKKMDLFYPFMLLLGKRALFSSDFDSKHRKTRLDFRKGLGPENIPNLIPMIDEYAKKFVSKWVHEGSYDLNKKAGEYLLPVFARAVFGVDLLNNREEMTAIGEHLTKILPFFVEIGLDPVFFLTPDFMKKMYIERKHPQLIEKAQQLLGDAKWLVKKAQEEGSAAKNAPGHMLMAAVDERGGWEKLTTDDVYNLLNPMVAGSDTSAGLFTVALTELAKKPEIQEQIRRELIVASGVSGEGEGEMLKSVEWNADMLSRKNLPTLFEFVESVLLEYPLAPIISRRASTDTSVYLVNSKTKDKYYKLDIYSGETVTLPLGYLNPVKGTRNKFISKARIDADHTVRYKSSKTFATGGKHECPGQFSITTTMQLLIVNIIAAGKQVENQGAFEGYNPAWHGTLVVQNEIKLLLSDYEPQTDIEGRENKKEDEELSVSMGGLSMSPPPPGPTTLRRRPVTVTATTETPTGHQTPPAEIGRLQVPPAQ